MITAAVCVDISVQGDDYERADRHRLWMLERVPDGATVHVIVGDRIYVSRDAEHLLRLHAERLNITIIADDPETAQRFLLAARSPSGVAA